MTNVYLRFANCIFLQSVKPVKAYKAWKLCFTTISDPEQPYMCCFGWMQWQPFKCFLLSVFFLSVFFFIFLILKKDGNFNCKQTPPSFQIPDSVNWFWKFYPFIEKYFRVTTFPRVLCFPVSFAKYFRTLFLRNTSG